MTLPLVFAAVIGFNHAFEADHVLAVGNIANKRNNLRHAIRDGLFWGLGHSSILFVIGSLIIFGKAAMSSFNFHLFETFVGVSLMLLGIFRLFRIHAKNSLQKESRAYNHSLAYSIGLLHGLAGSGAVVLVAISELNQTYESILYLVIFGLGSIIGMIVVAIVFSLPFTKKMKTSFIQTTLVWVSALLCIGYGAWIVGKDFL